MESVSELLRQLGEASNELESNKDAFSKFVILIAEIKEHAQDLENSFRKRFKDLEEREEAFEEKASATRRLIGEREADVARKEQESIDRIQQLRDAAVDVISEARKKFDFTKSPEPDCKVSSPSDNGLSKEESMISGVKLLHPKLKQLCEETDAKGLLRFLSENKRSCISLCGQIPIILEKAEDLARLVLDSLEVFNPLRENRNEMGDDILRRNCLLLMEAIAPSLNGEKPLSLEMREKVKAMADDWNSKLDSPEVDSLEAHALLQLLTTFNVAQEFEEEKLCKLIIAVCGRRQAAELCRSLGLDHKMPGVIETLVRSGRHLEAVHLIYVFRLTGKFLPAPLLRDYLASNCSSSGPQDDGARELSTLRAVIKCIEEYCLQSEFPLAPLQRRVADLKRARGENISYGSSKIRSKKSRGNSGGYFPRYLPADFRGGHSSPRFPGIDSRDDGRYVEIIRGFGVDQRQPQTPAYYDSSSKRFHVSGAPPALSHAQMPYHAPYEPSSFVPPSSARGLASYGPQTNYYPEEMSPTSSNGPPGYGSPGASAFPRNRAPYM